jgi:NitT/TauT family transport system substrate-binding protein
MQPKENQTDTLAHLWQCAAARALIPVAIAAAVFGLPACQDVGTGEMEPVRIGMESTAVNSLIYIAENRGYFAANGLDLAIVEYASGLAAVNGMLNDEVDLATAAEFVIVGKALTGDRIGTLGSIDKFMHNYLIGRKDRGIENVSDLEGKRIGLPLKTAAEFYLGRFLDLNGMNIDQVILVDVGPPQLVDALDNGDVDAVLAWQPNAKAIEDRLGNGIVKWPAQNEQVTYCNVVSTDAWTTGHPELVDRFLKSLARAEEYVIRHPAEARAIIQKRLKYDDAYMATIWPEHQFSLSLDQSLILAMEDEARWMINNNLTPEKKTPNFLDYVDTRGLDAIKPEAVNIIR